MTTKPQPSAPTANTAAPKPPRSRRAATAGDVAAAGRAGSAGGVVLERENPKKAASGSSAKTTKPPAAAAADSKDAQPKRKPRKLNKEPSPATKDTPVPPASTEAKELEALKSRVRGLEAKVEELYQSSPSVAAGGGGGGAAARSPRRRGKGRKSSSATATATLGGLAREKEKENQSPNQVPSLGDDDEEEEEEAEEELGRLQDELETARQHLALFHPSSTSTPPGQNPRARARRGAAEEGEEVEEVPRERPGAERQVTLSGSYRIPLPTSLNAEDVRTIQSGVAAAQNVARSFLDQRRAGRGALADGGGSTGAKPRMERAQGAEGCAGARETEGGKVGWGEWIGGYSVAISRAVKRIEHEAAVEAQRPGGKRGKRPGAKTALSGEQIEGLMG